MVSAAARRQPGCGECADALEYSGSCRDIMRGNGVAYGERLYQCLYDKINLLGNIHCGGLNGKKTDYARAVFCNFAFNSRMRRQQYRFGKKW